MIKHMPLRQQIRINRERLHKRFRVSKFIVYFQPFSNTYKQLSLLKADIETALSEEQVVGIVLGTRPDCLPDEIFPFLKQFNEQVYVSVELGVQSFVDDRLKFLKRGHTAQQSIEAIEKLHELSGINIGIHLIFGLPEENQDEIINTAQIVNDLPINNVKLHNLHVLAHTELAEYYQKELFTPLELDEYSRKVILFLEHLSQDKAVQRLAAVAPRWNELIAPAWTKDRLRPTQYIIKQMETRKTFQGRCLKSNMIKSH